MRVPVLIGYGHAGRDLHHRSLRMLGLAEGLVVVDPVRPRRADPSLNWVPDLTAALDALPDIGEAMFHVLTPVRQHLPVTRGLVAAGARQIILEKPITASFEEAVDLWRLSNRSCIAPVSIWPASRVTERVRELLGAGRIGELTALHFEQSKPRFRRNLDDRGHRSPLDVELPHQVLLALHMAGAVQALESARTWDSPVGGPLGGAVLVLRHVSGVRSTLVSDLTSPVKIRRLRLTGTRGEIQADYPISSEEDFGQVRVIDHEREVLQDAPLTRFLEGAYAYAAGDGPPPPGPLTDHVSVIALMDRAAAMINARRSVPC